MSSVDVAAGLTTEAATDLLRSCGPNALPPPRRRSAFRRAWTQLTDPMIILLAAACVLTIAVGDAVDTAVIAVVIVLNTAIGVTQEVRAERALAALSDLAAPTAQVIRDGLQKTVSAADLVPGDVVELKAGDVVPADVVASECHRLQLNESAITGESLPVDRSPDDELLAGTLVVRGRSLGTVARTGSQSSLGRIARLVEDAPTIATPLQRRLSKLSKQLVIAAVGAAVLVFVLGLLRGADVVEMLVLSISLAVAAVPESLPAVVSIALAMGAYRMAKSAAIVRRLPAVETLGSVSVIASDKTGTLTEGHIAVGSVWPVSGEERDVLLVCALCNDAQIIQSLDTSARVVGDPVDVALLEAAIDSGVDIGIERQRLPRVGETPFDNTRQLMLTWHTSASGENRACAKGAPEAIFELLDESPDIEIRAMSESLARGGFRVLAVANGTWISLDVPPAYRLVGLIALADPPKGAARGVVSACHDAGVRVVMITGDHPETALAVAAALGIADSQSQVVTGADLASVGADRIDTFRVFARIRPEQKMRIVEALQAKGHVVAMTGDGVNDAPALRAADIGVAMGRGGTEVARQAAELVLQDDELGTVVKAIGEGRRIAANIRSFLRYALAGGLAEVVVLVLMPFLGVPVPLLPAQILWINMLTHGLPGVAFGAEPLDASQMRRPPDSAMSSVLGNRLVWQISWSGSLIAAVTMCAGAIAHAEGYSIQTTIFAVLGFAQLGLALALRGRRPSLKAPRALDVAVIGAMFLQLAAVVMAPLQDLLGTAAVPLDAWAMIVALSSIPGLVVWLSRRSTRHR